MDAVVTKRLYRVKESDKTPLNLTRDEWLYATGFLLSMSMMGLQFPLGYLLTAFFLLNSLIKKKYDFLIQFFLFCGGYGFYFWKDVFVYLNPYDILLAASMLSLLIVRKDRVTKRVLWAILGYFVILCGFASLSPEPWSNQLLMIRRYMGTISLFVPLAIFVGRVFDIKKFFHLLVGYMIIVSVLYIIDSCIMGGFFLLPGLPWNGKPSGSVFWDPWINPLSMTFPRMYPYGLFFMALCVYPIIRFIRLGIGQWIIVGWALLLTRTMTFIASMVVSYLVFIGEAKKLIITTFSVIVVVVGLYFIDESTGGNLRVASTILQFADLNIEDEEDLAGFGTGRMAQIIPKVALLAEQGKVMTGFGFLNRERTTLPQFIIINPFYIDQTKAQEVATGVEVGQVQTVLDIGVLGLMIQIGFFLFLYYLVREYKYSLSFLCTALAMFVMSIGGFAGLCTNEGTIILGLSLGTILLYNRGIKAQNDFREKEE